MNRRQKNEEIRRAFENMQTVRRGGITLYIVQGKWFPSEFLVRRGPAGILFIKSGGNVHRAAAKAFTAIKTGEGLKPFQEGRDKQVFNEAFDMLAGRR